MCCDTTNLNQFQISPSNFTFRLTCADLLALSDASTEFHVPHNNYTDSPSPSPSPRQPLVRIFAGTMQKHT